MPNNQCLLMISAVLDASLDEIKKRRLSLSRVTRRLFALTETGERDAEVLKAAALDSSNTTDAPSQNDTRNT